MENSNRVRFKYLRNSVPILHGTKAKVRKGNEVDLTHHISLLEVPLEIVQGLIYSWTSVIKIPFTQIALGHMICDTDNE